MLTFTYAMLYHEDAVSYATENCLPADTLFIRDSVSCIGFAALARSAIHSRFVAITDAIAFSPYSISYSEVQLSRLGNQAGLLTR